ncbi:MAG: hypothetical protein CL677_09245 [Bdellovibrionaceae bacterium]|nr:hypothetical protein [Pseudobdellovibrionaceae bacterium]|tara:strand:- start:179 stop:868 length:690 start_codon:yes stop_codon:yes gene_type:complete
MDHNKKNENVLDEDFEVELESETEVKTHPEHPVVILNLNDLKLSEQALKGKCDDHNLFENLTLSDPTTTEPTLTADSEKASPGKVENADPFFELLKKDLDQTQALFNFEGLMTNKNENRVHKRVPLESKVLIKDENGKKLTSAVSVNISQNGLALFTKMGFVRDGQIINIEFIGDGNMQPIVVNCEVVRADGQGTHNTIGLKIINRSKHADHQITEYIAEKAGITKKTE